MSTLHSLLLLSALCLSFAASSALPPRATFTPTAHGIALTIGSQQVELAVQGGSAFRVSVALAAQPLSGPIDSPFLQPLDPSDFANFTVVTGDEVGIKTAFGQQTIHPVTAHYTLLDGEGNTLTTGILFTPQQHQQQQQQQQHYRASHALSSSSSLSSSRSFMSLEEAHERESAPFREQVLRDRAAFARSHNPLTDHFLRMAAADPALFASAFPPTPPASSLSSMNTSSSSPSSSSSSSSSPSSSSSSSSSSAPHSSSSPLSAAKNDTCSSPRFNTDVTAGDRIPQYPDGLSGQTLSSCCALCNQQPACTTFVWADNTHPDPSGKNCWLLMNVPAFKPAAGRTSGGTTIPPPPTVSFSLGVKSSSATKFFGAGGGYGTVTSLTATAATPHVANTEFTVPHYWCSDGYAALGVSPVPYDPKQVNYYNAAWSFTGSSVSWTMANAAQADLYLMPAANMSAGLRAYWDLTGRPRMLPRYAYGFMASRWGWTDRAYIESMLQSFRNGSFPIDAWISDFEWYTPTPDYSLPDSGSPTFQDFGYNSVTFPDPVAQLQHYHNDLHMRFGGIRKPRLGNTDLLNMARSRGWLASVSAGGSGGARNLNYSIPEVRDWYAQQLAHFLPEGVDFWWNDEGETLYFTFYWWNTAQAATLAGYDPNKRFFTINRSFSPGMQRLGLVIWTGDIQVSWDWMQHQPPYATAWTLAGAPYVTCDIGGFNGPDDTADLLVRWYQSGALLPIMRVHSTLNDKPHFPFLYGDFPAHCMRNALNLRYQLLPYTYSVASHMYTRGEPLVRPLAYAFPQDLTTYAITSQWLFGPSLMATPILTSSDGTTSDTARSVYLPAGLWYQLRYGATPFMAGTTTGPATVTVSNVALDQILFWAPAGAIVPMAPSTLQYTDMLPGGPLAVAVFPGQDGGFEMVEDSGSTLDYTRGVMRVIAFSWLDSARQLQWQVTSPYADAHSFTNLTATVYFAGGPRTSVVADIGTSGSFQF